MAAAAAPLHHQHHNNNKQPSALWLAQSRLRRRRYDDAAALCSGALQANALDQAAWYLLCRALTLRAWVDDADGGGDAEGVADALLDDHAVASAPRPGTSLARPMTGAAAGALSPAVRPVTGAGRPLTGFARPGTTASGAARPPTGSGARTALSTALRAARPGTGATGGGGARPVTSAGRLLRLGTASLAAAGGAGGAISTARLDLRRYAARPDLGRALGDYLAHVERDPRRALELAAHATRACGFGDWWWKATLGRAYARLGMLRDAEQQLASAARDQDMLCLTHALAGLQLRRDQPLAALATYAAAAARHPGHPDLHLAAARVHEALGRHGDALLSYRAALALDAGSAEALAGVAADHFYAGQPELALRTYRRLLQMAPPDAGTPPAAAAAAAAAAGAGGGAPAPAAAAVGHELWTNIALCCLHAGALDLVPGGFERALGAVASFGCGGGGDADGGQQQQQQQAAVWYAVGALALAIGDAAWAAQCFGLAAALDPAHAEAQNNLGALLARAGDAAGAARRFAAAAAAGVAPLHEPRFNAALAARRRGDLQGALEKVEEALALFPQHAESLELRRELRALLDAA